MHRLAVGARSEDALSHRPAISLIPQRAGILAARTPLDCREETVESCNLPCQHHSRLQHFSGKRIAPFAAALQLGLCSRSPRVARMNAVPLRGATRERSPSSERW